jgi:hypothetical protein
MSKATRSRRPWDTEPVVSNATDLAAQVAVAFSNPRVASEHVVARLSEVISECSFKRSGLVSELQVSLHLLLLGKDGANCNHLESAALGGDSDGLQLPCERGTLGVGPGIKVLADAPEGRGGVGRGAIACSSDVEDGTTAAGDSPDVEPKAATKERAIELKPI